MTSYLPNIDLHVHTLYSDGASSIEDVIRQAESNELEAIAITDHLHMIGADGLNDYAHEIRELSDGVNTRILVGLEIHPKGNYDFPSIEKGGYGIEIILADPIGEDANVLNRLSKEGIQEHFSKTYSIMCKRSEIDIIAHPLNLGRFAQFKSFGDIDPWLLHHLIEEAKRGHKCLEVMSGMSWWFPNSKVDEFTQEYSSFIRQAFDEGLKFSIGSDAHCVHGVGNTRWSHKVLYEVGATADDIISFET